MKCGWACLDLCGRGLLVAAIGLYATSLLAPAVEAPLSSGSGMRGYETLYASVLVSAEWPREPQLTVYAFAVSPNTAALAALALAIWRRGRKHKRVICALCLYACAAPLVLFVALFWPEQWPVLYGYWLWSGSFAAASGSAVCFMRADALKRNSPPEREG